MTRFDIFDVIEDLRRSGRPFCIATVVRTADVTSAKAGAKAAITEDGEVLGHLGGACVRRAICAASTTALTHGDARMISVRPLELMDTEDQKNTVEVHASGCPSGGTVDIFIEPYALSPQLVVVGDTPIGRAIAEHGRLLGFTTVIVSTDVAIVAEDRDFVVIASQGTRDMEAIRAAVASNAGYISMVSSKRKAAVLFERLASEGMHNKSLDRLNAPAGLDLGGIDPHEIAISILAEIIQARRSNEKLRAT